MTNPHPLVVYALYLLNSLRPKAQYLSVIGSYGWSSSVVQTIASMTGALKAEMIEPVLIKGLPGPEDLVLVDKLAETIATRHAEAGLV
jgi:flavorubredoxin